MKSKKHVILFGVLTVLLVAFVVFCHIYEGMYFRNMDNNLLWFYKYFASPGRYVCGIILLLHHGYLLFN